MTIFIGTSSDRILMVAGILLPVIFLAVYLSGKYEKPFEVISPINGLQKNFSLDAHSDKLHQGSSEIWETKQAVPFEYNYILRQGYRFKFIVLGIVPQQTPDLDLSKYNELNITLKSAKGKGILFYLYTAFPNDKKISHPSWPHQYILNTDTSFKEIRLSLDQFYTPDWWYTEVNQTKASLGSPMFQKTLAMSFGNCIHINTDIQDKITVQQMSFSVNLWPHFLKILPFIGAYFSLLFGYLYVRKRKKKELIFIETGAHPPLENFSDAKKVFHFMGMHYHESGYTISTLSKQTGISEVALEQIVREKTGRNVKQFIYDLRITEAARLLETTDLPVTELAEKVGFRSREHFSRMFKAKSGKSPQEVRKQVAKKGTHVYSE